MRSAECRGKVVAQQKAMGDEGRSREVEDAIFLQPRSNQEGQSMSSSLWSPSFEGYHQRSNIGMNSNTQFGLVLSIFGENAKLDLQDLVALASTCKDAHAYVGRRVHEYPQKQRCLCQARTRALKYTHFKDVRYAIEVNSAFNGLFHLM
jgi:hypothetical protein